MTTIILTAMIIGFGVSVVANIGISSALYIETRKKSESFKYFCKRYAEVVKKIEHFSCN